MSYFGNCSTSTYTIEEKRLTDNHSRIEKALAHLEERIKDDPQSPLIPDWTEKRRNLTTELETAKVMLESFKDQRVDKSFKLEKKRKLVQESMDDLTNKIADSMDEEERIRLAASHFEYSRKKNKIADDLRAEKDKQAIHIMDEINDYNRSEIIQALNNNEHHLLPKLFSSSQKTQELKNGLAVDVQVDNFDVVGRRHTPTKSTNDHPCRYRNCEWVGNSPQARNRHEDKKH